MSKPSPSATHAADAIATIAITYRDRLRRGWGRDIPEDELELLIDIMLSTIPPSPWNVPDPDLEDRVKNKVFAPLD